MPGKNEIAKSFFGLIYVLDAQAILLVLTHIAPFFQQYKICYRHHTVTSVSVKVQKEDA